MADWVEIDGAQGEGGGQVLRTALALSIVSGRPLRVERIRANRPRPGLARQHLTGVDAAAAICGGRARAPDGDLGVGSTTLEFTPAPVRAGDWRFAIGTAGSVSLLLHTVVWPLVLARGESTLVLTGGTHVPWSPTYEYLAQCWAPNLQRLGVSVELRLERAGFYPPGGGALHVRIQGGRRPAPVRWEQPVERPRWHGVSLQANLRPEVAERQRQGALEALETALLATGLLWPSDGHALAVGVLAADSPGTAIALVAEGPQCAACVTGLGERGRRAEDVGREAALAFATHVASGCPVDVHAADQLLLPLALAGEPASFLTPQATTHLTTNARVIEAFLPVRIGTEHAPDGGVRVTLRPA